MRGPRVHARCRFRFQLGLEPSPSPNCFDPTGCFGDVAFWPYADQGSTSWPRIDISLYGEIAWRAQLGFADLVMKFIAHGWSAGPTTPDRGMSGKS